jgi:CRISPR-associated protein Csh1
MNKKGKFVFKLFEKDIDSLFNESDGFSFEDYILLIFTGYYTENVLSSSYGTKKKEGDKDE